MLKSAICSYLDSCYLGFATQCDFKKYLNFLPLTTSPSPKNTHTHLKRPKRFFHYALLPSITTSFPRKIHIISLPNSITFSCSIPFFPRLLVKHRSLKMEDRGCPWGLVWPWDGGYIYHIPKLYYVVLVINQLCYLGQQRLVYVVNTAGQNSRPATAIGEKREPGHRPLFFLEINQLGAAWLI